MKPDGTPTVDEVMQQVEMLQEFEKQELVRRICAGGRSVIAGRYNYFHPSW